MNEVATTGVSSVALLMDMASMERLERIAEIMASGKSTVPQHLRGSKGDCFALTMQSMQWGMNPFAVAQKTHLINGTLGYEAQLVSAVINNSGAVKDRFNFEWFGTWEKIVGKFKEVTSQKKVDDNGRPKKYIVPDWEQKDEHGLGVKVWATLKGEHKPRELTLLLTQARTRNSTLWTEDPKQQLAYLAQKRWARLYAPDVILGVYSPDELEVTPVENVIDPTTGEITPPKPEGRPELQPYSDADFDKNAASWRGVIQSGRKSPDEIIAMVSTKGVLSDKQKKAIHNMAPIEQEDAAAGAPAQPEPTGGAMNDEQQQFVNEME
jgi:hypothetical protein